jgi:hypothetical protein
MEKLNVTSLAEMVSVAERLGRLEPAHAVFDPHAASSPKANIPHG